jgi:N-acetylglucosaminyldiphosphoundecaprenol N-acetyl-beta-D-mannosaminyltransferase
VIRAVVSGYYGFGNTGDEIMLRAIIMALRKAVGSIEFTVLSRDPHFTAKTHGVKAIRRTDPFAINLAIARSDIFISGGGSLLQDATGPKSIPYYLGLALWARLLGKPSVLYGQGIGPVKGYLGKRLLRWLVHLDLVCLRDEGSLRLLEDLAIDTGNVEVTADPVLFLGPGSRDEGRNLLAAQGVDISRPVIGVLPRPWKGQTHHYGILSKAATLLASHVGGQVVFVPLQASQDKQGLEDAGCVSAGAQVVEGGFEALYPMIAAMDLVISVRLHGAVLAAMSGVPTVAVSYDPKVDALSGIFQLPTLGLSQITLEDLLLTLEQTWSRRDEIRQDLLACSARLHSLSYRTAKLVAGLLEKRGTPEVLGYRFDPVDTQEAIGRARDMVRARDGAHLVVTANPETLFVAKRDPDLHEALLSADMVVADGIGVVWASRVLGRPLPGRVPGIELAGGVLEEAAREGWPVYLLGTREDAVARAAQRLPVAYPGLRVAGYHHGFFLPKEEQAIVDSIRASRARVLLVGLGVPRQERFLRRHLDGTGVSLGIGVGGALDVMAGDARRAPEWVRSLSLEWLYRLFREPRRWKRQLAIPWLIKETLRHRYLARREVGR